jgi:hypothetical protein
MSLQGQALCHPERPHLAKNKCKQCYNIDYRESHKEYNKRRHIQYNSLNPDSIKSNHYRRRYGLTLDEAKVKLQEQDGLCAICKKKLCFIEGKKGRDKPVVDHCHNTKKVRGILCIPCNLALGYMYDNPNLLQSAITYLQRNQN